MQIYPAYFHVFIHTHMFKSHYINRIVMFYQKNNMHYTLATYPAFEALNLDEYIVQVAHEF